VDFLDPDSVADAVGQKVHSVGELLDEHEATLPYESCKYFIKGIRIVLAAVEDYHAEWLEHINSLYSDNPGMRAVLIRQTSTNCLEILANIEESLLSLLDSSLRQPLFLIQPTLERVIATICNRPPPFELTLIPGYGYRYGFWGSCDFVSTELKKLSDFETKASRIEEASKLPRWIFFLVYPLVERNSALNQVVIVHELAHVINELCDLHSSVLPSSIEQTSFAAWVAEAEQSPKMQNKKHDEVESSCYQQCLALVEAWVKEIVSDVIAVHTVGPAYLFSFLAFFGNAAAPDVHDSEHPAPSYRGEMLVDELEYLGYLRKTDVIAEQIRQIAPQLKKNALQSVGRYKGAAQVAHKTIETTRKEIIQKLREFCRTFSYFQRIYEKQVPSLVEQLRLGVLPMDRYVPGTQPSAIPIAAILNAGWQLYRTESNSFYSLFVPTMKNAEKLVNLNRLLFKSLESNEVVRRYFE
jgi:hypothetical protein